MALMNLSSPHHHSLSKTSRLMAWVLLATLPGLAVQSYFYGYGTLINLVWASGLALGLEASFFEISTSCRSSSRVS